MSLIIRAPLRSDKEDWKALFADYQKFYRAKIPVETVENTWERIHDPSSAVNALVAELDGKLVGITHYLFHDSPGAAVRTVTSKTSMLTSSLGAMMPPAS